MKNQIDAKAGCLLVGDYVDEPELSEGEFVHHGEIVCTKVAADHIDRWSEGRFSQEDLPSIFLKVLQQETDGPSRVKMMESILKLQDLEIYRDYIKQFPENSTRPLEYLDKLFEQNIPLQKPTVATS
ncbi:MAG: hypothetical protein U0798_08245 [Gemmataceae bacterium]